MSSGRMVLESNLFGPLAKKMPGAVGRIVRRNGERVRTHAVRIMAGPKGGRLYRKGAIKKSYKTGGRKAKEFIEGGFKGTENGGKTQFTVGYKTHRASAPGEAPAIDYGNLRSGISVEMTGETTAMVGVAADYGAPLEFGTRKMAARPFMRPSVDAVQPAFEADLRNLESDLR